MSSVKQLTIDMSRARRCVSSTGMKMLEVYEPIDEHLRKIKDMTVRHDDVLLCAFPKSGLYKCLSVCVDLLTCICPHIYVCIYMDICMHVCIYI